ncbi:unnamed protein product [Dovyalis caffra]|uniref:Uncharacterized protein n=1 Tax=Dovyalis caffra TaxID=77055 RepID=A0AAV1SG76_9ROSI|nr:unnamed protein product [Dovyalis caffra]
MMIRKDMNVVEVNTGKMYFRPSLLALLDPQLVVGFQDWSCISGGPLNNSFPINDCLEKFENDPPVGISPSSVLKDTLKYVRYKIYCKDFGITLERLLFDKSKNSKLMSSPDDEGIGPRNLLLDNEREAKSMRSPTVSGISPDKLFPDKPISLTTFKFTAFNENEPAKLRLLRYIRLPKHSSMDPKSSLPVVFLKLDPLQVSSIAKRIRNIDKEYEQLLKIGKPEANGGWKMAREAIDGKCNELRC